MTHSARLAMHFEQKIKASGGAFVLSHPRSFVNVCFWWVPPALRRFDPATASQQDLETLGKVSVSCMHDRIAIEVNYSALFLCQMLIGFMVMADTMLDMQCRWHLGSRMPCRRQETP